MVSIRAALTQFYFRNSKYKKLFSGLDSDAALKELNAIPAAYPSKGMLRKFEVTESQFQGQPVFTISPKDKESKNGIDHILYLHGGGYVGAISIFHWHFIVKLVKQLGVTVTVPYYPRAPQHNVDANFAFMMPLYDDLISKHDPEKMAVMGDSAGAGLSLSLSQQIIAAGKKAPAKMILLSPWIDARAEDPEQIEIEKNDCILSINGLRAAGRSYAGPNALSDDRVSPGLASLEGLPPVAIFAGTYDILLTDARNFKTRIEEHAGYSCNYYEYEKMHHVWMLAPCPESTKCMNQIVSFIQS